MSDLTERRPAPSKKGKTPADTSSPAKRSRKGKEVEKTDFLEELSGEGYGNMSAESFSQGFVRILQPLSPAAMEDNANYVQGAKPGLFYNSATGSVYGKSIEVIPVYYKREWVEWRPNRGGFAGKHEPRSIEIDDSDFSNWIRVDNGNIVQDTHTFYAFLPKHPEVGLVLMPFTSTNIKPARSWNTLISMVRTPAGNQAPFFSSVWKLNSTKRTDGQNVWYSIGDGKANAERLRYITSEEYAQFVHPLREMASAMDVDYSKSEEQDSLSYAAIPVQKSIAYENADF